MIVDLREQARAARIAVPSPPTALQRPALGTWTGRMCNEYRSASVFEALATQLADTLGEDHEAVTTVRDFADEERKHGVLCGAVVESLGGQARAEIADPPPFPLHADAHPLEGALRNLLSVSCLSETVAVSLIGAEREDMPDGPLKDLLTEIWADECGHAHAGWKLVAELLPDDDALKQRLGEYLAVALGHLEVHELAHLPEDAVWPEGANTWGLCSGLDARALFYETVEGVILPGLERMGLPANRAWAERRAP
ncbi:MAG: ferritin-like domain-containing protein [Deltaproteobacteria bacterium]|nr:MAG: ferritin-like domain-containing protein [Deltaproteobacteria bacterium]